MACASREADHSRSRCDRLGRTAAARPRARCRRNRAPQMGITEEEQAEGRKAQATGAVTGPVPPVPEIDWRRLIGPLPGCMSGIPPPTGRRKECRMAIGSIRIEIVDPRGPQDDPLAQTAPTVGYVEVTHISLANAGRRTGAGGPRLDFLRPNGEIDDSRDHPPEQAHAIYVLSRWPQGWPTPDQETSNLIAGFLRWP